MIRHASGWTNNNTKDIASVSFLKTKLSSDPQSRFLPQFNEMDTMPNLDGHLMIGEADSESARQQPIAVFAVQVKTLSMNYFNKNKYGEMSDFKYSCDAGSLYAVIEKVTLDPVLLFMVDSRNGKAYWKYLSLELCIKLLKKDGQQTCTVYFNEEDEIDDLDLFYKQLLEIVESRDSATRNLVLMKNESSDGVRARMIESAIELNRLLDNDYRFVKECLFPHVKQFGLALHNSKGSSIVKVFTIIENEQGELVRNFELDDSSSGSGFFDVFGENDVMAFLRDPKELDFNEVVEGFCSNQIERFCKMAYLPPRFLSDDVLTEVVFYFLDALSSCYASLRDEACEVACFRDESILLDRVEDLWAAMSDADLYYYNDLGIGIAEDDFEGTLVLDPLKKLSKEKDVTYLNRALSQPLGDLGFRIVLDGDFPYDFVKSVIDELSGRDVDVVVRPWLKPEGMIAAEGCRSHSWEPQINVWYTTETYYEELEKLIRRTQSAYRFAIKDFSRSAACSYELSGCYRFFLKKSRDSRICILHKPGKKFETDWTYDCMPENPPEHGYDQSHIGFSYFDFCKAPLYSMLEYFLIGEICKCHHIHCVVFMGEHLGRKFK